MVLMSAELRLSTREILHAKASFYHLVRQFFLERNSIEVITSPLRLAPPTDLFLDHFQCKAHADPEVFYMHSSPEYAMKSLLMRGSSDIYQICQVARANEAGNWHSKTFTMLEWYRLGLDLKGLMDEVCALMSVLYSEQLTPIVLSYQQSYAQYLNIENIHVMSTQELKLYFKNNGLECSQDWQKDDFLHFMMTHLLEPKLQHEPLLIIYDYPASQAALARCKLDINNIEVADRFEVYSYGIEIGNGYNELTDLKIHEQRFAKDQNLRKAANKPSYPIDEVFLNDLREYGMPDAVGIAMGIDRMLSLSLNAKGLLPWCRPARKDDAV